MSDKNRPPEPHFDDYVPIETVSLREGSTLNFDLYLFLPRNEKVVRWLRAGVVFGPLHTQKLQQVGNPQLFVSKDQVAAYEACKAEARKALGSAGNVTIIKGTAPEKSSVIVKGTTPIKIFGRAIEKEAEKAPVIKKDQSGAPAPRIKVDVDFINVAIAAIRSVFLSICKTELTLQSPKPRTATSTAPFPVNIASFVDLNSGTIRGTVGLCFPGLTYLNLLSAATGLSFSQLNDNIALGAGEFMYHIFSAARPGLAAVGYSIDRAVPFLVMGEDISVRQILPERGFNFLINSASGQFQFEIGIKTGV